MCLSCHHLQWRFKLKGSRKMFRIIFILLYYIDLSTAREKEVLLLKSQSRFSSRGWRMRFQAIYSTLFTNLLSDIFDSDVIKMCTYVIKKILEQLISPMDIMFLMVQFHCKNSDFSCAKINFTSCVYKFSIFLF